MLALTLGVEGRYHRQDGMIAIQLVGFFFWGGEGCLFLFSETRIPYLTVLAVL